ncbi:Zn-ribbon domain-containing protein [Halorussus caseinilyticus]|uniref:Zn-ribbon domain-containing protein n=1 Tax=Halorussus caseinilyticus TaxID=3034025 RepID=UPI0023E879A9|nr:Zn-ribbon containing protein [Halorussus sp. DT72]
MPHQCTTCGRSFEDGSKEMLSGCPDCGGNKFQFDPAGAADGNAGETGGRASAATARKKTPENTGSTVGDASEIATAPETGGDDGGSAVNRAAATVRDWVSTRDDADASPASATDDSAPATDGQDSSPVTDDSAPVAEDSAQANARRNVVDESELPDEPPEEVAGPTADSDSEAEVVESPDDENPGLKELREELNSQFESIRIVEPGQYELNLMELYEREEYIISLKEDGKYVIEVPDAWDSTER